MRLLSLMLLVPCALPAATPLAGGLEVTYAAQHDPNVIALADDTRLTVIYAEGQWEQVEAWAEGQPLQLGFDAELGTVLRDADGKVALPVVDDLGARHPITVARTQCEEQAESTLDMQACTAQALERWDRQLNLNYRRLLSTLDGDRRAAVQAAQRAWLAWRDVQVEAISAVYRRDGSLWGLVAAGRRVDLTREQALRLGQLAAD